MNRPGLFDQPYPTSPGYKTGGTSRDAALKMQPRSHKLKREVLELLKRGAYTADECASALKVTVLACRPRLSELRAEHRIYDTGTRRLNSSGASAKVWRAVEPTNRMESLHD
jgi:predicted ArsR family transcriptional regulator